MAIKRLNYDKLISGAVTNIIPSSQYTQFSGYNALVGGAAFTQYDVDIASAGVSRPSPVVPGLYEALISGKTSEAMELFRQDRALRAFGPQSPRYAPSLVGQAVDTTRLPSGGTPPRGSFTSGPNIKRLSISELTIQGKLPLYTVSSVSDALPGGGTTTIQGLGVTQAAGLSLTELQGVRDIAVATSVYDVPMLTSPLTSYSRPGYTVPNVLMRESANVPQFQENYQSYLRNLPIATSAAIKAYKPGTASGLSNKLLSSGRLIDTRRESNYAIQNVGGLGTGQTTGSFALDVQADIATIPYQTQVIAATKIAKPSTPAKELLSLPMTSSYLPSAPPLTSFQETKLQRQFESEGVIKTQTIPLPTLPEQTSKALAPRATTNIGNVYYTAIQELAGRFQGNKLVYNTKKFGRVEFDLYSPKPTLLPR